MGRILDRAHEGDLARMITELFETEGYGPEELIPGLVRAIQVSALMLPDTQQALDEAADLLAEEV
jgi:hypothetical protein